MTQRHFIAIAATVAQMRLSKRNRMLVASALAREFAQFNPRFKHEKFIAACCPN